MREEVRAAIPNELQAEYDRLFAVFQPRSGTLTEITYHPAQARDLMIQLRAWINGHIESATRDAQVLAEAEAYARERVKAERPIGFGQRDRE